MKKAFIFLPVLTVALALMTACERTPVTTDEPEIKEKQEQAVMVDDKLYYNTYQVITTLRCGVMDGSITSEVSEYQLPTENNQSNFGAGYEYQHVDSNHIDIHMDTPDGWIRFCTGECKEYHGDDLCGLPEGFIGSQPCIRVESRYIVTNISTNEIRFLSDDDGLIISDILKNGVWNIEATADCLNNIELTIDGKVCYYHSDCGTFNDNVTQRSLSADSNTKTTINTLLEKYISLEEN